ncbi:MAG: UbiA family prenyltransferase [Planctomycetota bacterium]
MVRDLIKLARPHQWGKGAFVLIGPFYAFSQGVVELSPSFVLEALLAFVAFGLASSGCYVFNDIADREADALHPRKKKRPIASGRVPVGTAKAYGIALFAGAAAAVAVMPASEEATVWVAGLVLLYIINVMAYSALMKHRVIVDVVSLSIGFVIRVLVGCAAVEVMPSTWLLNSTLFLAMFLAFGKRLGERRTMAGEASSVESVRGVQKIYSDDLLRMAVVMTGVGTLITYAGYVQDQEGRYGPSVKDVADGAAWGFNWLWLTMLPATYGLLRCIVQLERGLYDDPTELALRDRGVKLAGVVFVALLVGLSLSSRGPGLGVAAG